MVDSWARSTKTNENNSGFFGSSAMVNVADTRTVLKSWWNVGFYYLDAGVDQYPFGASLLRAGLLYADAGIAPLDRPTPVTNADADWLAITTLNPYSVQLSRAVNVAWQINWGFGIDLPVKSQRRNDTGDTKVLYICWEIALNGEVSGFTMNGWWASLDALIRIP